MQLFALVPSAFTLGMLSIVRKGRGAIRVDGEMLVERVGERVMKVRLDKTFTPVLGCVANVVEIAEQRAPGM